MAGSRWLKRVFYPVLIRLSRGLHINDRVAVGTAVPLVSIYDLSAISGDGGHFPFSALKGKKILIVNIASDCGYTAQLSGLQSLFEKFSERLAIVAFPSNEFGEQAPGDDGAIGSFCKKDHGVSFPVMQKTFVKKGIRQHPVYAWLSEKPKNGWNDTGPTWNFCKYLVSPDGRLTHFFEAGVDPSHHLFLRAVQG